MFEYKQLNYYTKLLVHFIVVIDPNKLNLDQFHYQF